MSDLVRRVRQNLERHQLLPKDRRLLVAVSGGLDSMVLLAVLHKLAVSEKLKLTVAHANHQLRGSESDADEDLVVATAGVLGLPVHTGRLRVREELKRSRESLEMVARRLRHQFLNRIAVTASIGTIALAHQGDDQAELLLVRILRGTGGEGLGGMGWVDASPVNPALRLIRPLLNQSKADLLEFATAEGISFREDCSNQDREILRNRIRHELLPELERQYNPALRTVLQRTAQIVGAEAEFVAAEAQKWRLAARPRLFQRLPLALQRAVIRQQLWDLGHVGDFELVERLRTTELRVSVGATTILARGKAGIVQCSPAPAPFQTGQIEVQIRASMPPVRLGDATVICSVVPFRRIPKDSRPGEESFDATKIGTQVVFRHWQPGDRFRPLGRRQASKLQDLFVNRKVPANQRRNILVGVSESGEIFWVEGLPPGERFKINSRTRQVLTLKRERKG